MNNNKNDNMHPPNGVDPFQTLQSWNDETKINNWIHIQAMSYYTIINRWISIPPILISALSGTVLLSTSNDAIPNQYISIIAGILLTISAFLQGMKSFLQLDEKIAQHEKYAKLYKELTYNIEEFMLMPAKYYNIIINSSRVYSKSNYNSDKNRQKKASIKSDEDVVILQVENHEKYKSTGESINDPEYNLYKFINEVKKQKNFLSKNEPLPPQKLWDRLRKTLEKNEIILQNIHIGGVLTNSVSGQDNLSINNKYDSDEDCDEDSDDSYISKNDGNNKAMQDILLNIY